MKVLLPINLDRVRSPIPTLLREVAAGNGDHEFFSFSSPLDDEDRRCGARLWTLPHVRRISPGGVALRRFDVAHHASATRSNRLLCRAAKARSLGGTAHLFTANCEPYPTDRFLGHYEKAVRECDSLVAVSRAVSDGLEERWGRKADHIVPNGFDDEVYSLEGAGHQGGDLSGGRPFVLYASAMIDRKHPEFFLDLAERMPEAFFVMVGSTRDKERSEALQKRSGRMDNVNFVGHVGRLALRDLMREAAAMAWPSDYEGLPLTVVEAMGCGLPVIAQPRSSLPEIITHGEDGWMFGNSEIDDWVSCLRGILEWGAGKRKKFAEKARRSVCRRFTWRKIAEDYDRIYRAIG